ncbi:MFS transporter [Schaalia sp. 19OD2882]|uniref:MFS transporter n=1 Tax=Schaalia sp. 19OD2882 TaxID=2794089 RepID=UPI001C1F06E8|nr:glycoside-pentoside-hexuronide (GPH):cation symporter [Schaalia sp. 19OD2882]QWW19989.1 MFS transporter [Schaalia sp. 19OD2882]
MTNIQASKAIRPFGWRDKIGYMFGDFGNDFTFILQMMFFMVFYTDIMGIEAAHVGLLFLVARIVDAFTDVGMGRVVDVLKPSGGGRFRPWLLRMSIPVALAGASMFMPFMAEASYGVRIAYMCVTYLLWGSVFYTSINIPYGSMAAVVTDDPGQRASLSVFRSLGANLAYLIISAVLPQIVIVDNRIDPTRMAIAAVVCGVLAVVCYVLCWSNVQERIEAKVAGPAERIGFVQMLGTLGRNRALISLVAGAIVFLVGSQIAGTTTTYLWKDYFQRGDLMSLAQIISVAPVFILALVASWLAAKVGKKETIAVTLAIAAVVAIICWILRITNPFVFIAAFFIISIGVGMYNILVWAVITDVLDAQDVATGQRDDGTIYAIYSWSRKLGQALAGYIVGWAVSAVGYSAEAAKAGQAQSPEAVSGIYMLFLLIPGILYAITAVIMWFWFPLGRKKVLDNVEILRARKEAAEAQAPAPAQS